MFILKTLSLLPEPVKQGYSPDPKDQSTFFLIKLLIKLLIHMEV